MQNVCAATKLSMYSGVLALGIGDAVAAVSGKLMGRVKWPGKQHEICHEGLT